MDFKYLGFIILLGLLVLCGIGSFVRNFSVLLKIEKPTKKEISYNQNVAILTGALFMLWIVLVQISVN